MDTMHHFTLDGATFAVREMSGDPITFSVDEFPDITGTITVLGKAKDHWSVKVESDDRYQGAIVWSDQSAIKSVLELLCNATRERIKLLAS